MPISRKTLCIAYGLIALLALVTTWGNALSYLSLGVVGSNVAFWRDTLVNPASRFLTLDVFFLALAAREPSSATGTLGAFDVIGLVLATVAIMVYAAIALLRG